LILLMHRLWLKLGVREKVKLQLNSLGTISERLVYREVLVAYLKEHKETLDEDSLRRLVTNPLRILDSKNLEMKDVIDQAPKLMTYLGEESLTHFKAITTTLDELGVAYEINPRLVRGLDYYSKTVFEWVTDELGAQGTVCAGGRYDGLIEQLGGKPNHAVGFAMGMERLLALLEMRTDIPATRSVDVYLIRVGDKAERDGLRFAETIRNEIPGLKVQISVDGGSFKSQFKRADRTGAEFAFILGDDEVERDEVGIKALRQDSEQQTMPKNLAINFLREQLGL
jgi:histidyl-tRNA synthetase